MSSNEYDVLDTAGVVHRVGSGETWANKLIDLGNGKDIKVRATGTNWVVRDVGVTGTWHHTTHEYLFGFSDDSGNSSLVENVYIGEGDPAAASNERGGCVYMVPDHSGRVTFRNVNFNIEGALGVYGHEPGQSGGGGGTLHFENCYTNDCHHTGLRFSNNGCTVDDTVIHKSGDRTAERGFWIYEGTNGPGNTAELNNVDIITNGERQDIATNGDPTIVLNSVRSDAGYPGTDPNPTHYVPDTCPTDAVTAASGDTSSTSYEEIEANGQTMYTTDFSGNTIENLLIDCTTNNDIRLIADGADPTIRNIGFKGLFYGSQFAIQIGGSNGATGHVEIDHIYLGDGCAQSNSDHPHGPGGVFYHSVASADSVALKNICVRGFSNNAFYMENHASYGPVTWENCLTANCGVSHYRGDHPDDEIHNCVGYNDSGTRWGTASGGERFGRMIWTRGSGGIEAYDVNLDGGARSGDDFVANSGTSITVHSGETVGNASGDVTFASGVGSSPSHTAPDTTPMSAGAAASGGDSTAYTGPEFTLSAENSLAPGSPSTVSAGITNTHDTDELFFESELRVQTLGIMGSDSGWVDPQTTHNHSVTLDHESFPDNGVYHWRYTVTYGGDQGEDIRHGALVVENATSETTGTFAVNDGTGERALEPEGYDRIVVNHGDGTGEHVFWEINHMIDETVIPLLDFQQSDLSGWSGTTSGYEVNRNIGFYGPRTITASGDGFAEMGTYPGDIADRLPQRGDTFRYYWYTDSGSNVSGSHAPSMFFFWADTSFANAVPNLDADTFHMGVNDGTGYEKRAEVNMDVTQVEAGAWYYTEITSYPGIDDVTGQAFRMDETGDVPICPKATMVVPEGLGDGWALANNDSVGTLHSGLVAVIEDSGEDTDEVELASGESASGTLSWPADAAGTYEAIVTSDDDTRTTEFEVN